MFLPEVHAKLNEHGIQSVVLFGIEVCHLTSLALAECDRLTIVVF
jgi:hypothetical protein